MNLIKALINSENAETEIEALAIISEMRERMFNGEDPEELLYEVGLEPDYVMDLLGI
jgi:hypothetical protein